MTITIGPVVIQEDDVLGAIADCFSEAGKHPLDLSSTLSELAKALDRAYSGTSNLVASKLLEMEHLVRRANDPALADVIRASYETMQDQIRTTIDNALADAAAKGLEVSNKQLVNTILDGLGRAAGPLGLGYDLWQLTDAIQGGDPAKVGAEIVKTVAIGIATAVASVVIATTTVTLGTAVAIVGGISIGIAVAVENWMPQEWKEAIGELGLAAADAMVEAYDSAIAWMTDAFEAIGLTLSDVVDQIGQEVNDFFGMARNWIQRRDPLTRVCQTNCVTG